MAPHAKAKNLLDTQRNDRREPKTLLWIVFTDSWGLSMLIGCPFNVHGDTTPIAAPRPGSTGCPKFQQAADHLQSTCLNGKV
jgi:hypothetical protein